MSKLGKVFLFLSGLAVIIMVSVRYLLDGWQPFLWIPLIVFVAGLVLAIIVDFKFYRDFFAMRTTKHGMNMGAMIGLAVLLLISVNYLSVRFNKTFDVTSEKLNSLAPQSKDLLASLKNEIDVLVFYKGEDAKEERTKIRQNLEPYLEASSKLKVRYFNSYVENLKAQEYLNDLPDKDRGELFAFAQYQGKKVRIESPYGEEQITGAMIKASRAGNQKIYFVTGHGERDLNSQESDGLKDFKQALEESSFLVEPLNLLEKGKIPEDAKVVAIVGPTSQYLEPELKMLRDYGRHGGRLLIAIDPGQKHNLGLLTKPLGVEFKNNFILNDAINRLVGRGAASALGLVFDGSSEITRRFKTGQNFTIFDLASEVKPAPGIASSLKTVDLVQTDRTSFAINELKTPDMSKVQRHSQTLAVQVSGTLPEAGSADGAKTDGKGDKAEQKPDEKSKSSEFATVVFGDSDFLSNKSFFQGLNRDLALNTAAYLGGETDLLSIRPPQPKGTKLEMNQKVQIGVVLAAIAMPLLLLISSGVLWFRRRAA